MTLDATGQIATNDARILIVDDEPANVLLLRRILEREGFTHIKATTDAREVLAVFTAFDPDILLLDLHMPHLNGFEVMRRLRATLGEDVFVPMLVLTADASRRTREEALSIGAHDFLTKPFDPTEVLLRIRNLLRTRALHVRLARRSEGLEVRAEQEREALEGARIEVLERLALAAELRDNETYIHTQRVGDMTVRLGEAVGLRPDELALLRRAAPLHDIGKIGISDAVLLKPGKLTEEEFAHIRTHTIIGSELLADSAIPVLQTARVVALSHHEKWDGSGYPHGLRGEAIPIYGRIVAVADVFDALTHSRPYKRAWSVDEAVAEVIAQRGRHFDPDLVDAFVDLVAARVFESSSV